MERTHKLAEEMAHPLGLLYLLQTLPEKRRLLRVKLEPSPMELSPDLCTLEEMGGFLLQAVPQLADIR